MIDGSATTNRRRMPSGIAGFDSICSGGLPRGGITVVIGGAGAGKTIFGLQVLAAGARTRHERAIVVSFEESADRVLDNTRGFTWGGDALADGRIEIVDAQLSQTVEHGGDFDLAGLLAILGSRAKKSDARSVVFDGIDALLGYLPDGELVRREVLRLREWAHASGLSVIVTAKADRSDTRAATEYDFLQYIADCVVTLHHRVFEGTAQRFLRVSKYRGAAHSANELPLSLASEGLEVVSPVELTANEPAYVERVSTGVHRLDAMLDGGYHRGSSALISGVPGTAKTTLAAAFAEACALRGERTLYVTFDESSTQIERNVSSVGIRLEPHLQSGVLHVKALRRRAASPGGDVAHIRKLVHDLQPSNLIIDPLSAFVVRPGDFQSESVALQLLDMAKAKGITAVSTSLLGDGAPHSEQTPFGIATHVDTWIHVSYVIANGERNRALTIVKSRGTAHSNQVRELVLAGEGVTLADVYAEDGDVLMGTLRWQKENEARRARETSAAESALREKRAELALAETTEALARLASARSVQQAELALLRAESRADDERLGLEASKLLERRWVDKEPQTPGANSEPETESRS